MGSNLGRTINKGLKITGEIFQPVFEVEGLCPWAGMLSLYAPIVISVKVLFVISQPSHL